MTVATLGIVVDSDSARKGAANLDLLPPAADRAEKSFYRMGNSARSSAQQMRFLALQIPDVFQGLASGQSAMQVLIQQGGQMVQIMQMGPGGIGGSLVRVKEAMLEMITPARLLGAGLAGIGAVAVISALSWQKFALAVDDVAKSTNTATQAMADLQTAAAFKGMGADDFASAMGKFATSVYDARSGAGDLAKVLEWNRGVVSDLETTLGSVADIVARAKGDMMLQFSLLRQSGLPATIEMVRWMENYRATLEKSQALTKSLGATIDEQMIFKARQFSEAWDAAWVTFTVGARGAVINAAGMLQMLSDKAQDFYALVMGADKLGKEMLKGGAGTTLTSESDTGSLYGSLLKPSQAPVIDPVVMERSIQQSLELADSVGKIAKEYDVVKVKGARAHKELKLQMTELDRVFREVRRSTEEFAASLIEGFAKGESMAETLSHALDGLSSDLIKLGSKQVIGGLSQALLGGGTSGGGNATSGGNLLGGIGGMLGLTGPLGAVAGGALAIGGGFLASLFGNNQQKKQQQQQQMQQQLQEQQRAQQQAADAAARAAEEARREEERRIEEAKRLAERLAAVRQDAANREYAALNETETLSGRLADFDRKAAQEREASAREFGYVVVELERAQAAERSRIVKDSMQEQLSYYKNLRSTISDFVRGLDFGATSTLGPAEQFMAARNDYATQLALAQGGDRTAQGNITSVAQTLLDQARSYLGPSAAFGELSDRIKAQLGSLTDIAMSNDSQIQELQRMGAYTGDLVQLQMVANESAEEIIAELGRMRLDLKQSLEAIKLRAA